jgi:putative phosphoesterase
MLIAVIADTHGRFPANAARKLHGADEIWHLGDYCDQRTLDAVKAVGPPFYGVLGNNDWSLNLPRQLVLERVGKTFLLIHIPPSHIGGADFLLHGHTHVPRDETVGLTRVLNPGTCGGPSRGAPASWAWMDIHEKTAAVSWRLVRV